MGLITGLILRLAGGDKGLKLPDLIKYPFYSDKDGQIFPFKTFAMLCSLILNLVVSNVVGLLFRRGIIPVKYDVGGCCRTDNTKITDKSGPETDPYSSTTQIIFETKL